MFQVQGGGSVAGAEWVREENKKGLGFYSERNEELLQGSKQRGNTIPLTF